MPRSPGSAPIRPNPGINRGYLASFLRPDGTMIEANADCGPVVLEELQNHDVSVHAPPLRNFFMKPLIQQIAEILNQRDVIKTTSFKAS